MTEAQPISSLPMNRIAIYDDEPDARESLAETVEDAGFDPEIIERPFDSLESCVDALAQYDAAIVDHRLSPGNYGDFKGAEAVQGLYLRHSPALLVTGWSVGDPEDIQPFRRHLACVLQKGQYEADTLRDGLDVCVAEFQDRYSPERRPTRTVLRIAANFSDDGRMDRVDAFLASWDPAQGITFPVAMVPAELREFLVADQRFFVNANTGARSQHELYFENFELAPEIEDEAAASLHS